MPEFNRLPNEYRTDAGPTVLEVGTTIDGDPIKASIEYTDPVALLKFLHTLGGDRNLAKMAAQLMDSEDERAAHYDSKIGEN